MSLESWIRERLPQTFCAEWPEGNVEFCAGLEQLIRNRQQQSFVRTRGQGTTSVLMAAALYAVSEKLTPYVLLISRGLGCQRRSLEWLAEEAGLWEYILPQCRRNRIAPNQIELKQGGLIGCHSIHENLRGLTARAGDGLVRPSLILLDMESQPQSPARAAQIQQRVFDVHRFHSELSPCGIATVGEAWS